MDPLAGDPHVTIAIYCIALALIVALALLNTVIAERANELERRCCEDR